MLAGTTCATTATSIYVIPRANKDLTDRAAMMKPFARPVLALCLLALPASPAASQDQPDTTGATGSESVLVNGNQAKRAGDIPGAILSPDVIINGQPVIVGCTEGTADPQSQRVRQRQAQDPRLCQLSLPVSRLLRPRGTALRNSADRSTGTWSWRTRAGRR